MKRIFIAVLFLACFPVMTLAQTSWTAAIERVERSAKIYREYAFARGVHWAGSMYNGLHYTRHSCAILGRMIGQTAAIANLEKFEYPELMETADEDYAHEMLVFSISLENWVGAARAALAMSEAQWVNRWNLQCASSEICPACRAVKSDTPEADFVQDGSRLFVLGDIDRGFADRFKVALDKYSGIDEIILGSDGGSVVDAIRAGLMIRERSLTTTLDGNCNSACPLVFLGGTTRIVWASTARFGLHQISRGGNPVPLDDDIYILVSQYIREMGADHLGIVSLMASAAPDDMVYPDIDEYCDLGLATWVQRVCGF